MPVLRQILLGEQVLQARTVDEANLRVGREIGNEQILNALAHAVIVGVVLSERVVREREHDDDRAGVRLRQRDGGQGECRRDGEPFLWHATADATHEVSS